LFIADGTSAVCNYAVNASTGDLTLISSTPTSTGSKPVGIAVGGNGKFLFTANQGSNNVSGFTINADGSLTAMSGSPFTAGTTPVAVNVDPSGKFLYVANFDSSTISIFTISSSTLGSPASVTAGTNPNSLVTTQ
jgi:YVTN family beta-propeller protein